MNGEFDERHIWQRGKSGDEGGGGRSQGRKGGR